MKHILRVAICLLTFTLSLPSNAVEMKEIDLKCKSADAMRDSMLSQYNLELEKYEKITHEIEKARKKLEVLRARLLAKGVAIKIEKITESELVEKYIGEYEAADLTDVQSESAELRNLAIDFSEQQTIIKTLEAVASQSQMRYRQYELFGCSKNGKESHPDGSSTHEL